MSTSTNAVSASATTPLNPKTKNNDPTTSPGSKKLKMSDIQDQVIVKFNLIPLPDTTTAAAAAKEMNEKEKKLQDRIWNKYLSDRSAMENRSEANTRNIKDGKCNEEAKPWKSKSEEIRNLYAWHQLKSKLGSITRELLDGVDLNLVDNWDQCLYYDVSDAIFENDGTVRGVKVQTTFFSPYAIPAAVRLSLDYFYGHDPEGLFLSQGYTIDMKLLYFHPDRKGKPPQKLVQLRHNGMDFKRLDAHKVCDFCNHLNIDRQNVSLRYFLMKLLLFSSEWISKEDGGVYELDRTRSGYKYSSASDSDKENLIEKYDWLEYTVMSASRKIGRYHDCYDYKKFGKM